jgi:D-psicose/D-tagatose/L-ribulose 3-epimerase
MKVGIHVSLWTPNWDDSFYGYIKQAGELGFNVVELPLMAPATLDVAKIKNIIKDYDLEVCCGTGLGSHNDISMEEKSIREKGFEHLKICIEKAKELGSSLLGGVIHSAWGKHSNITEDSRKRSAEVIRKLAEKAKSLNMNLALECINRYESSFLNTAEQGNYLRSLIGMPNVGLHLDTYHMNIEENSIEGGMLNAGDALYHIHLSENNRGYPGNGSIDWNTVFSTAKKIKYQGYFVIESYVTPGTQTGKDVCIWRKIEKDKDASLKRSLEFIKSYYNTVL